MTFPQWLDLARLFVGSLTTAAALGFAAGIVGLFVVLRGEALMALALPQIVAVGAALALRWELEGWKTLPPPLAVASAALAYFVLTKRRGTAAWVLPCFYVAGLCLSFLLIANKGQEVSRMQTLFTGIDVAVTTERALAAVPVLLVAGVACAILWRRWLLLAQAPAAAELAGLRPHRWDALFLGLLTVSTLLGTDSLGVVMVRSLLFLPAGAVLPWSRRIPTAMVAAALAALAFVGAGFVLSVKMDWPLSQSIGGVGFAAAVLSHTARAGGAGAAGGQ
jgi:ABC-type Mn2+/Zn2+ transport system permease subunit